MTSTVLETGRGGPVYTERAYIDRALILWAFALSFFTAVGGVLAFDLNRIVSLSFFAATILLDLAGVYVIVHGVFRERDMSYLKTKGMMVQTTYSPTSTNDVLITTGINPVTGRTMEFKSHDAWFKPGAVLKTGDKIDIYVDPKKPGRYYMDLAPFEAKVKEMQQGSGV